MRVVIVDADYPDDTIERTVLEAAGCEVISARVREPASVAAAVANADAVICQWAEIEATTFAAAANVGLVVRYGVGVDNIDLDAARRHGVWVANVPGYGTEEVAAHAFASVMAGLRHLRDYDVNARSGTWDYQATGPIRRLSTLTFGCLGLGAIGRMVAERARPWFGEVVAHDPASDPAGRAVAPSGIEHLELDDLFRRSDVLSLHVPLTDETHHIVDERRLSLMPRGAVLVNTARGGLVDEQALQAALASGHLSVAAIDTWTEEPVSPDQPLLEERVIATPHAAWYSVEAEHELRRRAAESVVAWKTTGRPPHVVVAGSRNPN